jgi:MoxR-like ATPase
VTPEDVHAVVFDCLRHRVLVSYEAEAEGIGPDRFVSDLLGRVPMV